MKNNTNVQDAGKILRKAKRDSIVGIYFGAIIALVSLCAGSLFWSSSRAIPTTGPRSATAIAQRQHRAEELSPTRENLQMLATTEAQRETHDAEAIRGLIESIVYLLFAIAAIGAFVLYSSFRSKRTIGLMQEENGG